jgi:hypothetical protein
MAISYNLSLTQGTSADYVVCAKDDDDVHINLSGYSARGYIKEKYSNTGILLNLSPTVDTSYISGIVNISLTAAQTAALHVGQWPYDLEVYTTGGYVLKVLKGYVDIAPETTY